MDLGLLLVRDSGSACPVGWREAERGKRTAVMGIRQQTQGPRRELGSDENCLKVLDQPELF